MDDFKWREIRNGRLAMVAFLGFLAQHAATGKGPIENLAGERAGRHVMGSVFGCCVLGPARCCLHQLANLWLLHPSPVVSDHVADPWANNFCTNGVSLPISIF